VRFSHGSAERGTQFQTIRPRAVFHGIPGSPFPGMRIREKPDRGAAGEEPAVVDVGFRSLSSAKGQ